MSPYNQKGLSISKNETLFSEQNIDYVDNIAVTERFELLLQGCIGISGIPTSYNIDEDYVNSGKRRACDHVAVDSNIQMM